MAFIEYKGRINLEDEHGLSGFKEVAMLIDTTASPTPGDQIVSAYDLISVFAEALDDVTDCKITSITMTVPVVVAGLKGSAGEQGVAEGADLTLTTTRLSDDTDHERVYWLPGAKEGVFLPDFRRVDTADTQLLTFIAEFSNSAPHLVSISDQEQVLSITSGIYATRQRTG